MVRLHIMGASGSGTTTLGAVLAARLGVDHLDSDDFYWMPTDPPYTTPRPIEARIDLLHERARPDHGWILTGSALKWGVSVEPLYQLIVFLQLDPAVRMGRIRAREIERYGARIEPGGDMAVKSREFLEWAESYDAAGPERRSLAAHEAWLVTQTAPILRLNSLGSVTELADAILRHPVVMAKAGQY